MKLPSAQAYVFDINNVILVRNNPEGFKNYFNSRNGRQQSIDLKAAADTLDALTNLVYKHCPLCDFKRCTAAPTKQLEGKHLWNARCAEKITYEAMHKVMQQVVNDHLPVSSSNHKLCTELANYIADAQAQVAAWAIFEPGLTLLKEAVANGGASRTFILSNTPLVLFKHFSTAFHEVFSLIPEANIMLAGHHGTEKPSRSIFEACLAKFNLSPSDTLFIDDDLANITVAQSCGMQALWYTAVNTEE